MLTTNNEKLATRLRKLANHGMATRYYHDEVGINSRLDAIQAVALNAKLKMVESWSSARAINADRYDMLFAASPAGSYVETPIRDNRCHHVWNQFTIRVPGLRDSLRDLLKTEQIGTEIYYPVPCPPSRMFPVTRIQTWQPAENRTGFTRSDESAHFS